MSRYQGGAIISFIIVTVAIAALLIGGVAWLRHRGDVARQSQVVGTTEQGEGAKTPEGAASDKSGTVAENDFPAELPGSSQSQKETTRETDKADAPTSGNTGSSAATKKQQDEIASQVGALPQTGPVDTVITAVVLTVVTYAAIRYAMSRRELARVHTVL